MRVLQYAVRLSMLSKYFGQMSVALATLIEAFFFADNDTTLQEDDEVVILTSSEHLATLSERWHPQELENQD